MTNKCIWKITNYEKTKYRFSLELRGILEGAHEFLYTLMEDIIADERQNLWKLIPQDNSFRSLSQKLNSREKTFWKKVN